jgi:hypothetical protein
MCSILGESADSAVGPGLHPLDHPTRFRVDLVRTARRYLDILVEIDKCDALADTAVLEKAISRYDK